MNNERLGKVFSTKERKYFYDAGTGKISECSIGEAKVLNQVLTNKLDVSDLEKTNESLAKFIINENMLQCPEHRSFIYPTLKEYKKRITESCEQIIIELTEACNLRCGYCIYNEHHPNFRGFSNKKIDIDVAKASIRHVLEFHTGEEFALTFYGGEPLLNFETIRECIDYAIKIRPQVKIGVSFTTNLTLITPEIAKYLADVQVEYVNILCSMDGPKDIHDKYRRYLNGEGTFDKAYEGLRILLKNFYNKERKRTLGINCVLTPPYEENKFKEIVRFFEKDLNLPDGVSLRYSYLDKGEMDTEKLESAGSENNELKTIPADRWIVDELLNGNHDKKLFDMISRGMWMVANRVKSADVIDSTFLMSHCTPGKRRLYVTVDGRYLVCERTGNTPELGNYSDGINIENAYKIYIEDVVKEFNPKCDKCWARGMCGMCYTDSMTTDGVRKNTTKICKVNRTYVEDLLKNYCYFLEKDKSLLENMLNQYDFT